MGVFASIYEVILNSFKSRLDNFRKSRDVLYDYHMLVLNAGPKDLVVQLTVHP